MEEGTSLNRALCVCVCVGITALLTPDIIIVGLVGLDDYNSFTRLFAIFTASSIALIAASLFLLLACQ